MKLPKTPANPWKTKTSKTVYKNPWIHVEDHVAINPKGEDCQYGVVKFQNLAVGVVAIDKDGNTYLVGQHRYPLNEYSWEIPEGGSPIGEDPLEGAKRELKEETGLIAEHWEEVMELRLSNSVTDEKAIIYLATDLTEGESEPEPTENITLIKIPFTEVVQMILDGKITDTITVSAILKIDKLGRAKD